jgi:cytochrome c biogenesis protein CcmG/thiol:disulfide interchange protein DsbE
MGPVPSDALMALRVFLIVVTALANQAPDSAAPDFTLKTLAGDSVTLSSLKGRPVFVNFWASWCVPCRAEMAEIIHAYGAHAQQRLVVLAVNLTDQEHMADVRRFVSELRMPFPVLLDRNGKVRKSYRLRGVPTSVFIDTLGIIRLVNRGPITRETIQRGLAEILPAP